jgi:hypothetical protein
MALLITGLISICAPALYAGNWAPSGKNNDTKPDQKIESWCEVRGNLQILADADGSIHLICRLVSNDFCYSIPCWHGMPIGNRPAVKNNVPPGVNIEEGQKFIAYYDADHNLKVVLTESLNSTVTEEQGAETVTVTIGK